MPKLQDVAIAVDAQLVAEGRWPPKNINKIMGADYRYTYPTMGLFLAAVSGRLATRGHKFVFDRAFVTGALVQSVGQLVGSIDAETTSGGAQMMGLRGAGALTEPMRQLVADLINERAVPKARTAAPKKVGAKSATRRKSAAKKPAVTKQKPKKLSSKRATTSSKRGQ